MTSIPEEQERAVIEKTVQLMRIVDAYAFDYYDEGKLALSRIEVEREIRASLAATERQDSQALPEQPSVLRPCGYVSVDGTARMCRKCGQVHADPIYATPAPTQAEVRPKVRCSTCHEYIGGDPCRCEAARVAAPTQAPAEARRPLSDEQIDIAAESVDCHTCEYCDQRMHDFARAIEAAHGIGDQP